tara:strand:- start:106 stop:447 length:342 start_codon:yes stop_codon:yes gene_type:complete
MWKLSGTLAVTALLLGSAGSPAKMSTQTYQEVADENFRGKSKEYLCGEWDKYGSIRGVINSTPCFSLLNRPSSSLDISSAAIQASLKSLVFNVSTISRRFKIDRSDIGTKRRK